MYRLPDWLCKFISVTREPLLIRSSSDGFELVGDGSVSHFSDVVSAYDAASAPVVFSEDILRKFGVGGSRGLSIRVGDVYRRLYSRSDAEMIRSLEGVYNLWLSETVSNYLSDPSSFEFSHAFVINHPAFWILPELAGDESDVFRWRYVQTFLHTSGFVFEPVFSDTGVRWVLDDIGPHVLPDCSELCGYLRLAVSADTAEGAWIESAAKLHKFFDTDGSEREGVEYVKSALEKQIESVLGPIK